MEYSIILYMAICTYVNGGKVAKNTESLHALRSRETNSELYQLIESEPGLSKYELKNELKWSMGKTDGSIRRLLESGQIIIKKIERDGRQVSLIYPNSYRSTNVVKIPIMELEIHNPIWMNGAFMYALDSETIGVTGRRFRTWGNISRFMKEIPLRKDDEHIMFEFPEEFRRFYQLDRKHRVVSINANNVIINISGNIIEG